MHRRHLRGCTHSTYGAQLVFNNYPPAEAYAVVVLNKFTFRAHYVGGCANETPSRTSPVYCNSFCVASGRPVRRVCSSCGFLRFSCSTRGRPVACIETRGRRTFMRRSLYLPVRAHQPQSFWSCRRGRYCGRIRKGRAVCLARQKTSMACHKKSKKSTRPAAIRSRCITTQTRTANELL